jgi:two-component SAPR family response regulator
MPYINGIEVAKEILAVNPHQRVIFASAYVKDTVIDSIKNLK